MPDAPFTGRPLTGRPPSPMAPTGLAVDHSATHQITWHGSIRQYGLVRGARVALFGPPKAKALRPTGHSAVIERMRIPIIVAVSIAMTCGATYVLAHSLVIQFIGAWGARAWATLIPDAIALFAVVMTGLVLDYTFVTAATRFQMHALRGERGWAGAALLAMIFAGLTETATLAYLFYEIEPSSVSGVSVQVVTAIPIALFWVRSAGALICVAFLVMGVLPLVIQRGDLKRLAAARSGGTALGVMDQLLTVPGVSSRDQLVTALGNLLTIFDFTTRTPGDGGGTASEFAALTEHLRTLNQVGQHDQHSGTQGALAMPPSVPLLGTTTTHRRMHDGEGDETSLNQHGLDAYDAWEEMESWPGTRGVGANGSSASSPADGQGRDRDDDPFASGMYRPRVGYGQSGPSSRAAHNGHSGRGGGDQRDRHDSAGAAIAPTRYEVAVSLPAGNAHRGSAAGHSKASARSTRRDAGKTRREITREVTERHAAAFRLMDGDESLSHHPRGLGRLLAQELGYAVNMKEVQELARRWRAAHGMSHLHLDTYPIIPDDRAGEDASEDDGNDGNGSDGAAAMRGEPRSLGHGVIDEVDEALREGDTDPDRYATWVQPPEAIRQAGEAARRAWRDLERERDDPEGGSGELV